ncbi:uncharacterized protein AB675_11044 [Cyphellophora attinorum]|uniref:Xylanolytic transcriptional activator regulatory domain-containing protein n=1 Tax=Cyphellophora attinorum TaxID=1664694 RepID=A0A0N1H1C3_9EURO|nr:uncharacterized protein AB675_11044 [Phialophora attinorum]KPI34510.1 hypothetical protein AB675_11044 [Phialophora attinorum]
MATSDTCQSRLTRRHCGRPDSGEVGADALTWWSPEIEDVTPLSKSKSHGDARRGIPSTAFNSHGQSDFNNDMGRQHELRSATVSQLPPLAEAEILFEHFSRVMHPTLGVLHLPSIRTLLRDAYAAAAVGGDLDVSCLLLLLSVFAGAAMVWTPELGVSLAASEAQAIAAYKQYVRQALAMLDHARQPLKPSTMSLAAIATLSHVVANHDVLTSQSNVMLLRSRCVMLARQLGVDSLDTHVKRAARQIQRPNMIEIEVQRRVWWFIVSSDWLAGFSGGSQDGTYTFLPRFMHVDLPSDIDDECLTPDGFSKEPSPKRPTGMSSFIQRTKLSFIQRIKLAGLCRDIVDVLPSVPWAADGIDYGTILAVDQRMEKFLSNLPPFFKLDADFDRAQAASHDETPWIAVQALGINFSLQVRRCRLHRPYHLLSTKEPTYEYSRTMYIRSARNALGLAHAMDELATNSGLKASPYWIVRQNVFTAGLTLATNVSHNLDLPNVDVQGQSRHAAYKAPDLADSDALWSEFLSVAPDFDDAQWLSLVTFPEMAEA